MRRIGSTILILFMLLIMNAGALLGQDEDRQFQEAIRNFVASKIAQHGDFLVSQEKFLLSLINLINDEMRSRVGNVEIAKANYFKDLNKDLRELENLEARLKSKGISDFDIYISQLKQKISDLIDRGTVDFKKKRILEDAVQLLMVAEEMTAMGGVATSGEAARQRYLLTREKLEKTFGRIGISAPSMSSGEQITLYDLYKEWLRLNLTEFEAKYLKVNYFRNTLLKRSTRTQIQKMISQELELALLAFNQADFDLAFRLFDDIVKVYSELNFELSDVMYFAGEAAAGLQRYPTAEKYYLMCHEANPGSEYSIKSLVRLIHLSIIFEDPEKQEKYFNAYMENAGLNDPYREDVIISMAVSRFDRNQFRQAIALLEEVSPKSENYILARYLMAKGYAATRNFSAAKDILKQIATRKNVAPQLFYRAVLKYALILYEEGDYLRCINLLNRIGEEFTQFELVLDALAWSEFRYQQTLPIEQQNYRSVLDYIDLMLNKYYGSPYELELKALRAYILEITNHPTEAIDQYEEVYLSKKYKKLNDTYLSERAKLKELLLKSESLKNKALYKNDKDAYKKIIEYRGQVQNELDYYTLAEMSGEGSRLYSEAAKILRQLKEIERLKGLAKEKNDDILMKRLDDLELRLNATLANAPISEESLAKPYNFFELVPSSKYVSEMNYRNQKILESRRNLSMEIAQIESNMKSLDKEIERARLMKETRKMAALSREKLMLQEMKEKYERLLSLAYSVEVIPVKVELNKWADLGGFGIINVNFSQRKKVEGSLKYNSNVIANIEREFRIKKQAIEEKIREIEAQIKIMTMKAREEERQRVRAERERSFKEGYFDTRTSEFEPLQPEINLEGAPQEEEIKEEN